MDLVIMAAGIGSRFGKGIKQLTPVGPCGEVIMEYSIYDALEAGFDRVVFITRHDLLSTFKERAMKLSFSLSFTLRTWRENCGLMSRRELGSSFTLFILNESSSAPTPLKLIFMVKISSNHLFYKIVRPCRRLYMRHRPIIF